MSKLNEIVKVMPGFYSPMAAIEKGFEGKYVFAEDDLKKFDPKKPTPESIPRGHFVVAGNKKSYDVTIFALTSQILLRDKTKTALVKDVKSSSAARTDKNFTTIQEFVKGQEPNKSGKTKDVAELTFKCVGNVPVLDREGEPVYPVNQYNGEDAYYAETEAIRTDKTLDSRGTSRAYQKARNTLYASGTKDSLDTSKAVTYPILIVNA